MIPETVLGFEEIDQTQVAVVGGKGAHLGELSRIEDMRVLAGGRDLILNRELVRV